MPPTASSGSRRPRPHGPPAGRAVGGCVPSRCRGRRAGRRPPSPITSSIVASTAASAAWSERSSSQIGRDLLEVLEGVERSALLHARQPGPVGERRIGSASSNGSSTPSSNDGRRAVVDEPEEHPRALAVLGDDAGVDEQLEVPRHPRLGLAEDLGQVGDGEFGVPEQRHDPQARLLADRLQRVEHHSDRRHPRIVHQLHKDIYMFTTRPRRRRRGTTTCTPCGCRRRGVGRARRAGSTATSRRWPRRSRAARCSAA